MKRRDFLKSISVGIAAAVIVPKVLLKGATEKKELKPYSGPKYTVDELRLHDHCVDKDSREWMCTAIGYGNIELMALISDPLPNFIEIKSEHFDEYFIISGNHFAPGTGQP